MVLAGKVKVVKGKLKSERSCGGGRGKKNLTLKVQPEQGCQPLCSLCSREVLAVTCQDWDH